MTIIKTKQTCSLCGGDGWTDSSAELRRDGRTGDTTCVACGGTGTVAVSRSVITVGETVSWKTVADGDAVLGLPRLVEWHTGVVVELTEHDGVATASVDTETDHWFAVRRDQLRAIDENGR